MKLRERKFFGEQLKADRLVADFALETVEGHLHDVVVIERQKRQVADGKPRSAPGVGRGLHLMVAEFHKGIIGHRHHALAGIAVRIAEGVKLLEIQLCDAGLFLEFPAGGLFERLLHVLLPEGKLF